jgi:galactitol-specific phosphotransferase system IIC component
LSYSIEEGRAPLRLKVIWHYSMESKAMKSMKSYYWVGIVVAIVLGVCTLIPAPASKPSLLGYYAHCPFAPISTIICLVIAGVIYWLAKRKEK